MCKVMGHARVRARAQAPSKSGLAVRAAVHAIKQHACVRTLVYYGMAEGLVCAQLQLPVTTELPPMVAEARAAL